MMNNDILRHIRDLFEFDDSKMITVFSSGDGAVTPEEIRGLLKTTGDPLFIKCTDPQLAIFLNGLINEKRGKKEGSQPRLEQRLTNNIIFMKLKIAFNLKAEDVLEIMGLSGFTISKHELSAFFRKSGNKHYRECSNETLTQFLKGLGLKYREESVKQSEMPSSPL